MHQANRHYLKATKRLSCEYAEGDLVLTGWVIIWSAPCNMDSVWEWKCLAFSPVHGSPLVCLEMKRSYVFRAGFRRDGVPAQPCMWLNSPVSIHSGGTILHFCLCLRLRANHTGTSTGRPGLNGPRSPWKLVYTHHVMHLMQESMNTEVAVSVS